ncbi:MAG: cache domain-containing sensor histidine kinase [Acetivibrionales bacterium]
MSSYKTIEDKISIYSQQILIQTAGKMDNMLRNIENISLQIVSSNEIQDRLTRYENADRKEKESLSAEIEQKLSNIISTRNDIVGVNILMKNSNNVIVSGETFVNRSQYKSSTIYNLASQSGEKLVWTGALKNENEMATYTYITTLTRNIKSLYTGEDLGVLVIGVKEFALADTYSYIDLGPTGFVFIIDQNGNVVSHLQKNTITKPAMYSFINKVLGQPEDRERTFSAEVDGKKCLVSYTISEVTGWHMVSVVPYDYLMDRTREIGEITLGTSILILIIAILLSFLISLSISRPVEKLVRAMKKVEEGDLSVNVDFKNRNEIERLGESFNKMINNINYLIKRVYEAEIVKKEAEIRALQSQINPHFLYNTLAIIDGIASTKGEKEISRISQALGDIFRYSISGSKFATVEEEIKNVKLYLSIQEIRHSERFKSIFEVDDNVKGCVIAKLIVQPIVENAVIHGIERKRGQVYVKVLAKAQDSNLLIAVEDNGIGINKDELKILMEEINSADSFFRRSNQNRRYHIGIDNVNRRIKLYYGGEYGLKIESEEGRGTRVLMTIPQRKADEYIDVKCINS